MDHLADHLTRGGWLGTTISPDPMAPSLSERVLREAKPDSNLQLAADYSEVGVVTSRFGAYSVAAIPQNAAARLDRRFRDAIRKHIPQLYSVAGTTEIHLLQLSSGQKRARSGFAPLDSVASLDRFLRTLAKEISRVVPFVATAVAPLDEGTTSSDRQEIVRGLMRRALYDINVLLASESGITCGNNVVLVDRGDTFGLGLPPMEVVAAYTDPSLSIPVSSPTYSYVESTSSRLVQVADFAAYVGGRLTAVRDEARAHLSTTGRDSRWARLQAELRNLLSYADALNMHLVYCIPSIALEDDARPWRAHLLTPGTDERDAAKVMNTVSIRMRNAANRRGVFPPPGYPNMPERLEDW
jgi:hypothetical protein